MCELSWVYFFCLFVGTFAVVRVCVCVCVFHSHGICFIGPFSCVILCLCVCMFGTRDETERIRSFRWMTFVLLEVATYKRQPKIQTHNKDIEWPSPVNWNHSSHMDSNSVESNYVSISAAMQKQRQSKLTITIEAYDPTQKRKQLQCVIKEIRFHKRLKWQIKKRFIYYLHHLYFFLLLFFARGVFAKKILKLKIKTVFIEYDQKNRTHAFQFLLITK